MTFTEVLHAAQDTNDPRSYIDRVKKAVQAQLELLDSTSKVESTPYFNHTAVPDFIVSWPGESRKRTSQRAVFLRHSYRSIAEEGDERFLGNTGAIVLAIQPSGRNKLTAARATEAPVQSRLLLTDSDAVGVVASQEVVSKEAHNTNPLSELVRANFVRGAKGRIDRPAARRLVNLDDAGDRSGNLRASDLISAAFIEDAALRINRTAQLITLALKGSEHEDVDLELIGGTLSLAEMRHLIPWLLQRDPETIHETFWSYAGTLFGFKELEAIRADLIGLDLTPLIVANATRWSATRAYVGLNFDENPEAAANEATDESVVTSAYIPAELEQLDRAHSVYSPDRSDDADAILSVSEAADLDKPRGWGFHSGSLSALSVDAGGRRLYIAHLGNLLKKGRPGSSAATWEQVRATIGSTRLRRVQLHGIQSVVSVDAEQSPDIQAQTTKLSESLDDRYFVDGITVRYLAPGYDEGHSDVAIDFGQGLAIAQRNASIADLASAALGIVEYRNPATAGEIAGLLGREPAIEKKAGNPALDGNQTEQVNDLD